MKAKKIVTVVLLAAVILLTIGYNRGFAEGKEQIAPARVAVVCIDNIILKSSLHAKWKQEMEADETKSRAELEKLAKEVEMISADLNTRKLGSEDYLKLARQGSEKKAMLEATSKFYEQEIGLKIQQWTEQLYKKIRVAISQVARDKGLDMVIAKEDLDSADSREIMTLIRTSKVLYHTEQMDITDEVLAVLDAK